MYGTLCAHRPELCNTAAIQLDERPARCSSRSHSGLRAPISLKTANNTSVTIIRGNRDHEVLRPVSHQIWRAQNDSACDFAGASTSALLHASEQQHASAGSGCRPSMFLHTLWDIPRGVGYLGVEKHDMNAPTHGCRSREVAFPPPPS